MYYSSKRYYVTVILCIWFSMWQISAQNRPPVHNFNVHDYKAGIQNWGITYGDNKVYVANNEGLMEFDGIKWRFYELPNKTIVRSVAYFDGKIYTGSYEEFGFWEKSKTGELEYHSLSEKVPEKDIETESIWGIYQFGNTIIFKSFTSLFIYNKGEIKTIKPNTTIMGANVVGNHFYVFGRNQGILELQDDSLRLLKDTQELKDYKVQAITGLSDGRILIGTSLNGIFVWNGRNIETWKHPVNALLKQNQLNKISTNKDYIFLGTIKNGIYVLNKKTNRFYNLNVHNGLQNNTVLGSTINDRGILWISLDNGISAIPIYFNAFYLNPSKVDIGGVYDMVVYNGETYIATNTGVYISNEKGITFVEGSQGHIWDLTLVDDIIVCGHNLGTYQIKNKKWESISVENGGYTFEKLDLLPNSYIQGNYSGLTLYTKNNSDWTITNIKGIDFPVKKIVFENTHTAWVAHPYKGVYRIHFSDDFKEVTQVEEKHNEAFKNNYLIKPFKVEGQIAFYNDNQWFVYNSLEEKIEPFESLNTILKNDRDAYPISDQGIKPIVFKKKDGLLFIRKNLNNEESQFYVPDRYYADRLIKGEEKAIVVNDSMIQIALYNDILVVNNKKISEERVSYQPEINRILKNGVPQPLDTIASFKQKDTIEIEISTPFLSNNSVVYSISGTETDYRKVEQGKIILNNLPDGQTVLDIRSIIKTGLSDKGVKLLLQVKKPWYMGYWGVLLFMIVLILLSLFIHSINKYVLIRHKKYLEDQFEHQKELNRKEEALKHEKKINELQKKQHRQELKSKTKELANTALEMTRKNEILMNLKDELLYFKSEIINKTRYNKLLKEIDKDINNSNDWEIFESNFNEIHDAFFKDLLKLHPDTLTAKDIKLCAYLKMNLSSKEIAPLMGISVRGVEIHRYRLRKKLALSTDQGLNEYLMNISS